VPRKKKKPQPPIREYDLNFSDLTLTETEGQFKRVKHLVENDSGNTFFILKNGRKTAIKSASPPGDWVVKSNLSIVSPMGEGGYTLDFYHDRRVYIIGYGGNMDPMQNADVRCLSSWCQAAGWKVPQVTESVARENIFFWRSLWDTMLIDCDFFDAKYGKRKSTGQRADKEDEDDEFF
jgi:hypothetical protein